MSETVNTIAPPVTRELSWLVGKNAVRSATAGSRNEWVASQATALALAIFAGNAGERATAAFAMRCYRHARSRAAQA